MIAHIEEFAKKNKSRIAIGCSSDDRQSSVTVTGAYQAMKRGFVEPILVGKKILDDFGLDNRISNDPSKTLVNMLVDGEVDGIVRGSLISSNFMKAIKSINKNSQTTFTSRIALIQSMVNESSFLLGPIGIDEGFSLEEKKHIIDRGIEIIKFLEVNPKISILAAGKESQDLGRHEFADITIREAKKLVEEFELNCNINTDGILIEDSITKGANLIVSINGVIGNLIYRSLVKLSSEWKAFGAILVTNSAKIQDKIIIDTSQHSTLHEYRRSLILASALHGAKSS